MKNGTQPGILISDLMSGDGPHLAMAENFVLRRCEVCGGQTTGQLVCQDQRLHCAACLSSRAGLLVGA